MTNKQKTLSKAQAELLRWIIKFVETHGFQPNQSEMAEHFGVQRRAIYDRLLLLEEKGYIEMTERQERCVKLKYVKFKAEVDENIAPE